MPKRIVITLLLIVPLVYCPLMTADFTIWDDPHTLRDNKALQPPTWQRVAEYWMPTRPEATAAGQAVNHEYGLWVPLTYTVWSGLAALAQVRGAMREVELNPYVFHLGNLLLHTAATLAVFLLLNALKFSRRSAFIGALLWAIHPVQTETVGWLSGLKDLLAGALAMWAMLLYVSSADAAMSRRYRRMAWYGGLLCFGLAMLSKPSAVTVPLLLVVIEVLLLRRSFRQIAVALLPWFFAVIPIALIARYAQGGADIAPIAIFYRPLIVADSIAFYLYKTVWPLWLGIDYSRTPHNVIRSGAVYWTWIIPLAVFIAAIGYARRSERDRFRPLAAFMLFCLAPLPVLGFLPFTFQAFSTTADHYMYVMMLGPAVLLAHWAERCESARARWVFTALLCVLAIRTLVQAAAWRDSESLFRMSLWANPNSYGASNNLGAVLSEQNNHPAAAELFKRSVELEPKQVLGYKNLRQVQTAMRDYDAAIETLRAEYRYRVTAPQANVGHAWLHYQFASLQRLNDGDYDGAVELLRERLKQAPADVDAGIMLDLAKEMQRRATTTSAPAE